MVACSERGTFWLLTGYCAVNILFNTLGLYLTKVGSAILQSLAYALLLPLTTVIFAAPFLGAYQETISVYTIAGLIFVMTGFWVYQRFSNRIGEMEEGEEDAGYSQQIDEEELYRSPGSWLSILHSWSPT